MKRFFYQLAILTFLPILTSCVATAVAVGAGTAAVVGSDSRSMNVMFDDRNIAYQAESVLNKDKALKDNTNLGVSSFNYNLLLIGQATTPELKARAEQDVKAVPKVNNVYNQITIGRPITTLSESSDSWITAKVKSAMVSEKGLKSSQIKVITENSAVYLMGLTTHAQGDLAAKVASKVAGVQKVVKVFDYVG